MGNIKETNKSRTLKKEEDPKNSKFQYNLDLDEQKDKSQKEQLKKGMNQLFSSLYILIELSNGHKVMKQNFLIYNSFSFYRVKPFFVSGCPQK